MRKTTPITLQDLLHQTVRRLEKARLSYGHGTFNAAEETAFIVMEALKLDPGTPADKKLSAAQHGKVLEIVGERIATRKPAAYLVNKMYLQGLPFYVDERVIVPRSFIAEILADFPLADPARVKSVLDLCTGSACLAILAAHVFPRAKVDAVELSAKACEVAKRNIRDYKLAKRVKLLKGDLFAPLKGKKYDLIITNPPYVAPGSMKKLPKEYRHEPDMALAGGGKDGMDIVRRILTQAPKHLNPGGGLLCEVGNAKKALEKAFPHLPFVWLDTAASAGEVFFLTREDFR